MPFNEEVLCGIKDELLGNYKGREYLYHRSALQALVMNSITS
jgi:hypothetical protein